MFGTQRYPEEWSPKQVDDLRWHVWSGTGALKVLDRGEYRVALEKHPDQKYLINFANGSKAVVRPGELLWQVMNRIAKEYDVQVFLLGWGGPYVPWTGDPNSPKEFDAITIAVKQ